MTTLLSIGNSRTACAMLQGDGRLAGVRRVPTAGLDVAALGLADDPIHLISVVENRARDLVDGLRRTGHGVTWWGVDREIPVRHPYVPPERPGADRLVAALAAFRRVASACIVVDAGTAVTVDAIAADGAFLGGAIAPGVAALSDGLRARAPALPRADPNGPPEYPARATAAAVTIGVHAAFSAALRELVAAARAVVGPAPVFVTGGDAVTAALALDRFSPIVVPELVLEGLAALASLQ